MAFDLKTQPWYVGLIIGVILAGVIIYAVHAYVVQPIKEQIAAADAQIAELDKKIEQGRAAERKLPSGERSFLEAKIATARFYADHVLVQAPALRNTVVNGAAGVMALSEDQFLAA